MKHIMKKLIATAAACLFAFAAGAVDLTNAPLFQLGLVVDTPTSDSVQMSLTNSIGYGAVHRETFNVCKMVAFNQDALKSASVVKYKQYNDLFEVEITFNTEGRKRLEEFTGQNVGKRIAIILLGELDSAPWLKSENSNGKMSVGFYKSEEKAKDLAARINAAIAEK